jgi:hypothetical protein
MDSNAIETLAVSSVRDIVALSDGLNQFISINDKEPAFDGFVNLYHSNRKTNENFYGRVTVQVKGTQKKVKPKETTVKFSVKIANLQMSLKEGGIMFFVVAVSPNGSCRIFYNDLLPLKIRNILDDAQGQKTKSLRFREIPNTPEGVKRIFFAFYDQKKKQPPALVDLPHMSTIDELQKHGILENVTFSIQNMFEDQDPVDSFLNNDTYIYATLKGSLVCLPVSFLDDDSKKMVTYQVSKAVVSGESIYNGYEVTRTKEETVINIKDWFVITLSDVDDNTAIKTNIKFNPRGSLKERLQDFEFLISFLEIGGFYLGDDFFDFKEATESWLETNFDIDNLRKYQIFLKNVKEVFDILHISENMDITNLSNRDFRELRILIKAFVDKKPIDNLRKDLPFNYYIKIKNVTIALYHYKKDEHEYVETIFNKSLSFGFDSAEKKHFVPVYAMLDKDEWSKISNIDYSSVVPTFQDFYSDYSDPMIFNVANSTLLSILLAYDETKKGELLTLAIDLSNWLVENPMSETLDNSFLTINQLQSIHRARPLNPDELRLLADMAVNSSLEIKIRIGAYLLLGNQHLAEALHKQLDKETKEFFPTWPIYRFWTETTTT